MTGGGGAGSPCYNPKLEREPRERGNHGVERGTERSPPCFVYIKKNRWSLADTQTRKNRQHIHFSTHRHTNRHTDTDNIYTDTQTHRRRPHKHRHADTDDILMSPKWLCLSSDMSKLILCICTGFRIPFAFGFAFAFSVVFQFDNRVGRIPSRLAQPLLSALIICFVRLYWY